MKRPFGIQFPTTESTYLGSSHVPTFVLTCFLARACVKSRFTRLGAPIPLVDGFLHDNVICRYGCVGKIVADRGELDTEEAEELFDRLGVKLSLTTTYNPEANGKVERGHGPIVKALVRACGGQVGNWPRLLPYALSCLHLLFVIHTSSELQDEHPSFSLTILCFLNNIKILFIKLLCSIGILAPSFDLIYHSYLSSK